MEYLFNEKKHETNEIVSRNIQTIVKFSATMTLQDEKTYKKTRT